MIQDSRRELDMRGPEQKPTLPPPTSLEKKGVHSFARATSVRGTPTIVAPPEVKKPEIKKVKKGLNTAARIGIAATTIAGMVESVGAGVNEQLNQQPVSTQTIKADLAWPWNLTKSAVEDIGRLLHKEVVVPPTYDPNSTKPQIIQAGPNGNARPATTEKIQDFLNQTPVLEHPTDQGQAPRVSVLLSVNPEKTKEISVTKFTSKGYFGTGTGSSYDYDYLEFNIKGNDAPFTLPLIEGAKKVDAKLSINAGGVSDILLRYYFNDGQIRHARISFYDNNFTPTDIMKSIPEYNLSVVKTTEELETSPTKEFNLEDNPHIEFFYPKGSTRIYFGLDMIDSFALSPSLATSEGKALYNPPTP